MSSKSRTEHNKVKIKSNFSKSYDKCLKQGIPTGKKYGSDFTDGFIVKRYSYPPYSWNASLLSSNKKKVLTRHKNKKPVHRLEKKNTVKSKARKIKKNSSQRSKTKPKTTARRKSPKP